MACWAFEAQGVAATKEVQPMIGMLIPLCISSARPRSTQGKFTASLGCDDNNPSSHVLTLKAALSGLRLRFVRGLLSSHRGGLPFSIVP